MTQRMPYDSSILLAVFDKSKVYSNESIRRFVVDNYGDGEETDRILPSMLSRMDTLGFKISESVKKRKMIDFVPGDQHLDSRQRKTSEIPDWIQQLSSEFSLEDALRPLRSDQVVYARYDEADEYAIQDILERDNEFESQQIDDSQDSAARKHLKSRFGRPAELQDRTSRRAKSTSNLSGKKKKAINIDTPTVGGQCPICGLPSADGYRQCSFHIQRAKRLLRHPTTQTWQEDVKWLRSLSRQQDLLWLLDTEFSIFPGLCAVAWEVAIRDLSGREVMRCVVDYGGATVDDLLEKYKRISPPGHELAPATERRIRSSFERIYPDGKAWGTTFSQMRQALIRRGFDPAKHAVISYGTTLDMQVFWKILNGIDAPLIIHTAKEDFKLGRLQRSCLQPVNVYWLAKEMVVCDEYSLKKVYRRLFGLEDGKLHRAPMDTLILVDIVRLLVGYD